jgi:hypothetical protein
LLRSRWVTAIGPTLSLAGIAFALGATTVLAQRWQQPAYAMPLAVVVVAGACTWLTVAGAALALRRREVARPWLTLLATLLFVWAFLLMFSYGPVVFIAAVVILVLRARLIDEQPVARRGLRIGAGLLLSLGLVPLSVLAVIERPVVECTDGGTATSAPIWSSLGQQRVSGTASASSLSNVRTGTVTIDGTTYFYACAGDRLTTFIRR